MKQFCIGKIKNITNEIELKNTVLVEEDTGTTIFYDEDGNPSQVGGILQIASTDSVDLKVGRFYHETDTDKAFYYDGKEKVYLGSADIAVDTELSATSENPVQNKSVTTALGSILHGIGNCVIFGEESENESVLVVKDVIVIHNGRIKQIDQIEIPFDSIDNKYIYFDIKEEESETTYTFTISDTAPTGEYEMIVYPDEYGNLMSSFLSQETSTLRYLVESITGLQDRINSINIPSVDSALSRYSSNAIANKAVAEEFDGIQRVLGNCVFCYCDETWTEGNDVPDKIAIKSGTVILPDFIGTISNVEITDVRKYTYAALTYDEKTCEVYSTDEDPYKKYAKRKYALIAIHDTENNIYKRYYTPSFYTLMEAYNNSIENGTKIKQIEDTKVDKVEGKDLSTEDYTAEEKEKLALLKNTVVEKRVFKNVVSGRSYICTASESLQNGVIVNAYRQLNPAMENVEKMIGEVTENVENEFVYNPDNLTTNPEEGFQFVDKINIPFTMNKTDNLYHTDTIRKSDYALLVKLVEKGGE